MGRISMMLLALAASLCAACDKSTRVTAPEGEKATVGMLQSFVGGADDCWEWTCDHLKSLYASLGPSLQQTEPERRETIGNLSGEYLGRMRELGRTTARFHIALASDRDLPPFAPEPVTADDIARWQDLFSSQIRTVLGLAAEKLDSLPDSIASELASITANESGVRRASERTADSPAPKSKSHAAMEGGVSGAG